MARRKSPAPAFAGSPVIPLSAADRRARLVFELLGDPTRYGVLGILEEGERNVGTLVEILGMNQPSLSHHLAMMRASGVVATRRDGKFVCYSLSKLGQAALKGLKLIRAAAAEEG